MWDGLDEVILINDVTFSQFITRALLLLERALFKAETTARDLMMEKLPSSKNEDEYLSVFVI